MFSDCARGVFLLPQACGRLHLMPYTSHRVVPQHRSVTESN